MASKRMFSFAFRQASPMRSLSPKKYILDDDNEESDRETNEQRKFNDEQIKKFTDSIDRLTELARQDSFSSIRSATERKQFTTALNSLQKEVFGNLGYENKESVQHQNRVPQFMETPNSDTSPNEPRTFEIYGNQQHISQGDIVSLNETEQSATATRAPQTLPINTIASNMEHVTTNETISSSTSSQDSEDSSNGFVKLEHPTDLLADYSTFGEMSLKRPEGFQQIENIECTPSDEISPLSSEMEQEYEKTSVLTRDSDINETTFEKVADVASAGYEKLAETAEAAYKGAAHAVGTAYDKTADLAQATYDKAADMAEAAKDKTGETIELISDTSIDAQQRASGAVGDAFDTAVSAADAVKDKAGQAAHDAYDKVADAAHVFNDTSEETIKLLEEKETKPDIRDIQKAELDNAANIAKEAKEKDVVADFSIRGASTNAGFATDTAKQAGQADFNIDRETYKGQAAYDNLGSAFDEFDTLADTSEKKPSGHYDEPQSFDSSASNDNIRDEVNGVHDEVESLIRQMHSANAPSATSKEQFQQEYQRDVSPEELTFERQGPLTIPQRAPGKPEGDLLLFDEQPPKHHGFDVEPRPPTPPKEHDDQEVKPTVIDVGPPPHKTTPSSSEHPRSILKHPSQGAWCACDLKSLDPRLLDLIYWRDPKKSAVVLSLSLLTLIVFAKFPLITVLSYAGLAVLGGTLGFRIYKAVEAQIKKTDSANPFQPYLESEVSIPQERIHKQVDVFLEHSQLVVTQLRRLFLVEDIVDSVKFGVLLWALTYIGYWFSGLCLLMLIVIAVFSVPKIYEVYQEPIDRTLAVAKEHANNVSNIISEKVPFLKKQVHEKST